MTVEEAMEHVFIKMPKEYKNEKELEELVA